MNVELLSEHVFYLMVKYDLYVSCWLKSPAWNSTDISGDDLRIAEINSENAYCSALHEFGHIIGKTKDELKAWRWAKRNALIWTDTMQKIAESCLFRYGVEFKKL